MRFYRVHFWEGEMSSHGFKFFARRTDAEKASRAWVKDIIDSKNGNWGPTGDIDEIDIQPTKAGILEALNQYASHNDNG